VADPTQGARPGIRVVAVGDLQLGDSPTAVGFGFRSRHPDERTMHAWADYVGGILGEADLAFGNLEGVISEAGLQPGVWRSVQLRGRPFYPRHLRDAGFHVVNVANNHSFQHGIAAFEDTVRLVQEAGLGVVGMRGEAPWSSVPWVSSIRGRTVGVLGYCLRPRQYSPERPPYAEGTPVAIAEDVSRLRRAVDSVIVSLHWGEEFVATPSEHEVAIATEIVSSGADLILGHHPHVLRDVQRIGGAIVAYSLGNFSGDMVWHEPLRTGGVLRCLLADGVREANVQPVRIHRDHLPRPVGEPRPPSERIATLDEMTYARAIERTIRAQRTAAYAYTLRNLFRFPPRMLLQLGARTVRNKLDAWGRR
jgi:poly-gamma-glutamate synthesis protein (capsule biosynthesis protein)